MAPPQSFLVQSGYLTFKGVAADLGYILGYPNREVQDSFSQLILWNTYNTPPEKERALKVAIIQGLRAHDFQPVFDAMNRALANIPSVLYSDAADGYAGREAYYHSILLTLLWACELHIHAEERSSRGDSDLVLARSDRY
jgi:hypothetical protein